MKNFLLLVALLSCAVEILAQGEDFSVKEKTIVPDSLIKFHNLNSINELHFDLKIPEQEKWMLDYETFKQEIIKMPWRKPFFIPGVSKEGDEKIIYQEPVREPKASSINPITLIYNRFNKRERFKRTLERNRRRFNREMQRIGADSLMVPE